MTVSYARIITTERPFLVLAVLVFKRSMKGGEPVGGVGFRPVKLANPEGAFLHRSNTFNQP
ncbi:hypothetical protein NIES4071_06360 [Calothrix sp. NIES-4071]|nr:hypothetical protein NIES4071_06360 [Calothrix sp. NIES-4071]BAZ54979.1 hypothetical protein NIES4105_06330 [Calothrix sp. NIES-4105]